MLKNDVIIPSSPEIQNYVTCFQYFETNGPIVMETIPNGHMDLTLVFKGGFSVNDLIAQRTIHVNAAYLFPITTNKLFINFQTPSCGLNIKFKPTVKSVDHFDLNDKMTNELVNQIRNNTATLKDNDSTHLEFLLMEYFNKKSVDHNLKSLIRGIIYAEQNKKLIDIAEDFHIQLKQMTRLIKKHIGVSPKELRSLQRFYLAADELRKTKISEERSFSEVIPLTYYDQSHFIKECRKITGLNPKQVFKMMNFDISDLLT